MLNKKEDLKEFKDLIRHYEGLLKKDENSIPVLFRYYHCQISYHKILAENAEKDYDICSKLLGEIIEDGSKDFELIVKYKKKVDRAISKIKDYKGKINNLEAKTGELFKNNNSVIKKQKKQDSKF
jgi:hypothetical protein